MDDQRDEWARRASSFGSQAAAYAEHRPDYPSALFEWGLTGLRTVADLKVADIGAGTGKLTQGLVALGVDVVAIEPDPAMLAQLKILFPDVEALPGSAEDTGLADNSVNAIFAGQALHWFDLNRAFPEFRRVLRPGGSVVAAWNAYDDRIPWVAEMVSISDGIGRHRAPDELERRLESFGPHDKAELPNPMRQTIEGLVNMSATQSRMLVATPEEREATLGPLRRFLETNPATAQGEFMTPMVTYAIRVTPE